MAKKFRKSVDYLSLFDTGPKTSKEVVTITKMEYQLVNYHLKRLVDLGYLCRRKDALVPHGFIYELSEREKGRKHSKRDINLDKPTGGRKPHGNDTFRWITGENKTWRKAILDLKELEKEGKRANRNTSPIAFTIEAALIKRYNEANDLRGNGVLDKGVNEADREKYRTFVETLRSCATTLEAIAKEDRLWNEEVVKLLPSHEEVLEHLKRKGH